MNACVCVTWIGLGFDTHAYACVCVKEITVSNKIITISKIVNQFYGCIRLFFFTVKVSSHGIDDRYLTFSNFGSHKTKAVPAFEFVQNSNL